MKLPKFLAPPPHREQDPDAPVDSRYKKLRLQVFLGIFIGYAGYYLVRKNFSMAMPDLIKQGYSKTQLGFAFFAVAIAYGMSKFVMGSVSDRSNARVFLPLGLVLSGLTMIVMGVFSFATASLATMFVLLLLNGWFQGMGWPPSGRVVVHWFSIKERATRMAIWNCAHNVGGGLVGPLCVLGILLFHQWQAQLYFPGIIAIAVAVFAYLTIRDTPQSQGLPPIEVYKNNYAKDYNASHEKELTTRQILFQYVLVNRMIWYIAFANVFVYLVRYGIADWAPTYLTEVKHFSKSQVATSVFTFEYAGIPGTLLCGWLSDRIFRGRRAPTAIIYMALVAGALLVYWKNPAGNPTIDMIALGAIGFLIYGPVMLIGVQALDMVPKKAAGTAAGLTGLFGYLGDGIFSKIGLGYVVDKWGWNESFMVLLAASILAILLTGLTWKREKIRLNHS